MTITSILFAVVARNRWDWSCWKVGGVTALFLVVDLAFVGANLLKIPHGGWFPLVVAGLVFILMSTWKKGRVRLAALVRENTLPMDLFLQDIRRRQPHRVRGAAVFLTSDTTGAPPVLLHHLKHNQVLHEKVMLMSILTEEIPQVDQADRVRCQELGEGFYQVVAHYGFMETPDVPAILRALGADRQRRQAGGGRAHQHHLLSGARDADRDRRPGAGRTPPPRTVGRMARWRKKLFIVMTRNAQSATAFFNLPPNRVVELGAQIQF